MPDDFFQRVEDLKADVGSGTLAGEVEVNQSYAQFQHETMNLNHPRGGGPKFLIGPLIANHEAYLQDIARSSFAEGRSITDAMIDSMEDLAGALDPAAPIDEDPNPIRLRQSGNPKVTDDGIEVYNRPPVSPRETEEAEIVGNNRGDL